MEHAAGGSSPTALLFLLGARAKLEVQGHGPHHPPWALLAPSPTPPPLRAAVNTGEMVRSPCGLAVARFLCGRATSSHTTVASAVGPSRALGDGGYAACLSILGPGRCSWAAPAPCRGSGTRPTAPGSAAGSGAGTSHATKCLCPGAPHRVSRVRQPRCKAGGSNSLLRPGWAAAWGMGTPLPGPCGGRGGPG